MASEAVIVKFGGAALTNKCERRCLKSPAVDLMVNAIARTWASGFRQLIVVHGAGSFGHFEAKAGRLNSKLEEDQPFKTPSAIACTRASLCLLDSRILDALTALDVPAVNVPVFPHGRSYASDASALQRAGFLPVLHGDVIMTGTGCRVVSGDEICETLATAMLAGIEPPAELKPVLGGTRDSGTPSHTRRCVRVVFVTGADGVFTAAATNPKAVLIREIYTRTRAPSPATTGEGHPVASTSDLRAGTHITSTDVLGYLARSHHVCLTSPALPMPSDSACEALPTTCSVALVSGTASSRSGDGGAVADTTGGIVTKLHTAVCLSLLGTSMVGGDIPHGTSFESGTSTGCSRNTRVDVYIVGTSSASDLEALLDGSSSRDRCRAVLGTYVTARWDDEGATT